MRKPVLPGYHHVQQIVVLGLLYLAGVSISAEELAENYDTDPEVIQDVLDQLVAEGKVSYVGNGHYEPTKAGEKDLGVACGCA